jgi:hypothetical protein
LEELRDECADKLGEFSVESLDGRYIEEDGTFTTSPPIREGNYLHYDIPRVRVVCENLEYCLDERSESNIHVCTNSPAREDSSTS